MTNIFRILFFLTIGSLLFWCTSTTLADDASAQPRISGRYPHLATTNHQGECGTGAVVPWAGKLWYISYAPHQPNGSDDKLYEIGPDLKLIVHAQSVGGTPANRMIHRESNQLIIGPYFIDDKGAVRTISPKTMPGRLTATMRHLTDPVNKIYMLDMEGMLYEVDVHSLAVTKLFDRVANGAHAKGGYVGQGRMVIANNGSQIANKAQPALVDPEYAKDPEAAGNLAEWNGKTWTTILRRQFTDVTGPGGINGSPEDSSPIWAMGWDRRSVILKLLDHGTWSTYRLPKSDHSYDPKHGWHTEWPRIREVGDGKYLMNMHGGWFEFPKTFSATNTAGIKPIGVHLKITGDFCQWQDQLVFGCDDTAKSAFKAGGKYDTLNDVIGQSCSNLWFTKWDDLKDYGRTSGDGGVWLHDSVTANQPSDPYLVAGYTGKTLYLSHTTDHVVTYKMQIDIDGNGLWKDADSISLPANGSTIYPIDQFKCQWIRLTANADAKDVSAVFHYGIGGGAKEDKSLFAALADIKDNSPWTAGVGRSEANKDTVTTGLILQEVLADGNQGKERHVRFDQSMKSSAIADADPGHGVLTKKTKTTTPIFTVDDASVVLVEGAKRFRLPKSNAAYDKPFATGWPRELREVVTERAIMNVHGTFYMLPRLDSGGVARIKPISTHNKKITDFYSWRGMLVLLGTKANAKPDGHFFPASADSNIGAWFGDIDDLWKLGKPNGHGGPWMNTAVKTGEYSDPYLITGYDQKSITLTTQANEPVKITIEVDPLCDGFWREWKTFIVPAGQPVTEKNILPNTFGWIRAKANMDCKATVQLEYN